MCIGVLFFRDDHFESILISWIISFVQSGVKYSIILIQYIDVLDIHTTLCIVYVFCGTLILLYCKCILLKPLVMKSPLVLHETTFSSRVYFVLLCKFTLSGVAVLFCLSVIVSCVEWKASDFMLAFHLSSQFVPADPCMNTVQKF